MSLLSFTALLFLLSKCHGQTQFIYTTHKEKLDCYSSKWQICTDPYSTIDVNCTVKCVHVKPYVQDDITIRDFCTNKGLQRSDEQCLTITRSVFLKCVTDLGSGFLYPFKPSNNTIASYIVAFPKPDLNMQEESSTLMITEGDLITLNCSINQTYNQAFVLYWIKISGQSSTCMYSYDFNVNEGVKHNPYCNEQKELYNRFTNQTVEQYTHNIRIINVTEWDAGRYLCALHLSPYKDGKGNWEVIKNITVCMNNSESCNIDGQRSEGDPHLALYVTILILLSLLVVVMVICLWKKSRNSSVSQVSQLQRNQNGEETHYVDCSPYAMGTGEEEHEFRSKWTSSKKEDHEVLATSIDPYSVVKMNDVYDSSA